MQVELRPAVTKPISINPVQRDPALLPVVFLLWALMALFVLYPAGCLLQTIFYTDSQWTLANLTHVFSNWYDRAAIVNSMGLAMAVAGAGTVIGFLFAFAVARTNLPKFFKLLLGAVIVLPLVSPPFTSSIAITLALGPNGMVLNALGLPNLSIYGFWGTWLSETLTYFPVAYLTLTAVLMAIDPTLEDAALSLGSSRLRTFAMVTVPLAIPGIANAFLLLFASSLSDFATPLVLAGHSFPILPTQAYLQITGLHDLKGGAALSFILIIPALLVYVLQRYWVSQRSYVTVTGKAGAQTKLRATGRWGEIFVGAACSSVCIFILFLYLIIFLGSLVKVWGVDYRLTMDNFNYVFTRGGKAIADTLIIAAVATPLGGLLAVAIGYITTRKQFMGNKLLEFVSILNYSLPGTVVGIAYIIAFNTGPVVLTGTLAIIVAAYVFRYEATGIRSTIAALHQIDNSLEEAALSLGATPFRVFRKITLPLIIPAVISGMKFLLVRSMTAISATIFLVSVSWSLLTTRILECITEMQFAQAAAFSVVLIGIIFLISGILSILFRLAYPHTARSN
jgi:iron(III) transport system permease protein